MMQYKLKRYALVLTRAYYSGGICSVRFEPNILAIPNSDIFGVMCNPIECYMLSNLYEQHTIANTCEDIGSPVLCHQLYVHLWASLILPLPLDLLNMNE